MGIFRRVARAARSPHPRPLEVIGLALVTVGIGQVYEPAALVFAGAALVFIAQGLEQRE